MRYLIIALSIFLVSCETKSIYKHYPDKRIQEKFLQSQKFIANRKSLLDGISLSQKAEFFEKTILKKMHPKHKFCPKLYSNGAPGKLRMDMTALFLSSLTFKYAVNKNEADKKNILAILDSIYRADKSNGLDGFIPYKVKIEKDQLVTSSNETHINVYTQLLFAYIPLLRYSQDKEIETEVIKHLRLIVNHLQKTNFTLVDHEGQEVEYSDLSPKSLTLQSNRQQLLLIFVDLSLKFNLGTEMKELRENLRKKNYEEKIQDMHFKIFNLEFPTHSSSWLNLSNSFIGFHIDNKAYYKTAFENLHKNYKNEDNALFELMLCSMTKEKVKLSQISEKLKKFPINPTNHEVVNRLNPELQLVHNPTFRKLKRELEVATSLPFYQRPMRSFEWKLNQMRVEGNFKSTGQYTYTGIDYLIAYWILRWLQESSF